ncbi:DUF4174 domain-containing protein [Tenacibaculum sp. 190524A05c]|uniref:DUF4174 domain-containing protein n=1 Tax=Tenacibaculum platacis TaxID=3137852 RepID=UPI0031FB8A7D
MKYYLLVFVLVLCTSILPAQNLDLSEFEWKNRVLLTVSNSNSSLLALEQMTVFNSNAKGFKERKLILFEIQPERYRKITVNDMSIIKTDWKYSNKPYLKYQSKKVKFKALLIGLDGGIKNTKTNKIFTQTDLFAIIDGMPMRKRELRKKQ